MGPLAASLIGSAPFRQCAITTTELLCITAIGAARLPPWVRGLNRCRDNVLRRAAKHCDSQDRSALFWMQALDQRAFDDVASSLPRFIEDVYNAKRRDNAKRRHSALGYKSPVKFEEERARQMAN
jgi:hypothetical protein